MRRAALALALTASAALAGCAGNALRSEPAAQPLFQPDVFFAGETVGTGTLKVIGRERVATYVEGVGRVLPDGSIRLRQRVTKGRKRLTTRTWVLTPAGDRRWTGTLTGAEGPVEAEARGNVFHVRYDKDGLAMEQWLYLEPNGRTVKNTLVARKLGMTVAKLEETIRKVG